MHFVHLFCGFEAIFVKKHANIKNYSKNIRLGNCFCEKYIVYSDNQVEARYVLTTAFIERFKNMKTAFKAKFIRAAFKDGKITIAIDAGRDLFQMASLDKDTDSNTFTELFDEILSVLELISVLKLNQKIGL